MCTFKKVVSVNTRVNWSSPQSGLLFPSGRLYWEQSELSPSRPWQTGTDAEHQLSFGPVNIRQSSEHTIYAATTWSIQIII